MGETMHVIGGVHTLTGYSRTGAVCCVMTATSYCQPPSHGDLEMPLELSNPVTHLPWSCVLGLLKGMLII